MIYESLSLTPALSRWERENCFQPLGKPAAGFCLVATEFREDTQRLFPLPAGEGQGEGERNALSKLMSS